MDVKTLSESIEQKLRSLPGSQLHKSEIAYDFPVFTIGKETLIETLRYLKDVEGFSFLTTLCGIHNPDDTGKEFCMMYQLHKLESNERIRIKTEMHKDDLQVPSLTELWPAANWMERQEYDFFGFEFTGHPDLRRILNMDEMNYFPMRKEYPLEDGSRDDKNDKMFGR